MIAKCAKQIRFHRCSTELEGPVADVAPPPQIMQSGAGKIVVSYQCMIGPCQGRIATVCTPEHEHGNPLPTQSHRDCPNPPNVPSSLTLTSSRSISRAFFAQACCNCSDPVFQPVFQQVFVSSSIRKPWTDEGRRPGNPPIFSLTASPFET